jgi:uncharacterized protein (TIGR03437 family)
MFRIFRDCKKTMVPAICMALCAWPAASQVIATFAGDGLATYSGDGAPAVNASLNQPRGMAIDAAGNVYIADPGNARVRVVNASGIISTYAGNGISAFSGDGGQASAASVSDVNSVALDAEGNLYVADSTNRLIRKIAPGGVISTIAGTAGVQGYSGDGGPATKATLGRPVAVVVDAGGNVDYVDSVNQVIRRITPAGIISTIAGNSAGNFSGDGGLATSASLNFPLGMALGSGGTIYIADAENNRIRMINAGGIITTIAGNGVGTFSGDGALAINASLNIPSDVALDGAGNLYVADSGNNRIREVNLATGVISTIAGTANNGFSGDGGLAASAMLNHPWSVTVSSSGNIYVGDMSNMRVREILPATTGLIPPAFPANGVVNAASFSTSLAVAPGALAAVFGSNLASSTTSATVVPLPTSLGQTTVTFNGVQAPLFFVSATQINAQVPFTTSIGPTAVQVTHSGMISAVQTINLATFSPGVFLLDEAGDGAIFHAATFTAITPGSPAIPGEAVVIYATGLGPVSPASPSGVAGTAASTTTTPTVTIGGIHCSVLYSGIAPGLVGVYQINAIVPAGLATGNQPVQIVISGILSNTALVAVAP